MSNTNNAVKQNTTFSLSDLEAQVMELEGVRIVFRSPVRLKINGISYADKYTNKVAQNGNVTLLINRIKSIIKAATNANQRGWLSGYPIDEITFDIIDGTGNVPNGGTHIVTVRNSYIK
ncbi:hypothetical protein TOTORO_00970 [Serratia phage vB_SmaS-Totoro]|nr:hypothetical protein TOTORO_00970 [Serratia phage vB_SmaS-Totoro]